MSHSGFNAEAWLSDCFSPIGVAVNERELPLLIESMHMASRFMVGASFLLTAVANHSVTIALFQLTLFILTLMIFANGGNRILRAIGLLRWLVIPIVLLHAMFTPGTLIIAGMAWPVSVEGLQAGFWFSLHLTVIFFAAILFSQLLTEREWIHGSLKIPFVGHALLPYTVLMNRCWDRIQPMLKSEYSVWRKEKQGLRSLLLHLSHMPIRALDVSREIAGHIWSDWDQQIIALVDDKKEQNISSVTTILALSIVMLMWMIIFFGGDLGG